VGAQRGADLGFGLLGVPVQDPFVNGFETHGWLMLLSTQDMGFSMRPCLGWLGLDSAGGYLTLGHFTRTRRISQFGEGGILFLNSHHIEMKRLLATGKGKSGKPWDWVPKIKLRLPV
jgi:hypothetical protein